MVIFLSFGNILLEHSVKFIKVYYKILDPSKGDVMIGVNKNSKVIVFVNIEWGDISSNIWSIVVCEFYEQKEYTLIILLKVNVCLKYTIPIRCI